MFESKKKKDAKRQLEAFAKNYAVKDVKKTNKKRNNGKKKKTPLSYLAILVVVLFGVSIFANGGKEKPENFSKSAIVEAEQNEDNVSEQIKTEDNNLVKNEDINAVEVIPFSLDQIEPYTNEAYVNVNNNIPYFDSSEITLKEFEYYSALDSLGRSGAAFANISPNTLPNEARAESLSTEPSGWHSVSYDSTNGVSLYNRCHLIGYQLAGENDNELNLFTGTGYLNAVGMLRFEDEVANYVKSTGNHVLYRVTPMYEGDNLLASGVLMEALSVEDNGKTIQFCVYCYNVQPNISIDYATGESRDLLAPEVISLGEDAEEILNTTVTKELSIAEEDTTNTTSQVTQEEVVQQESKETIVNTKEEKQESEPKRVSYIGNKNTKKFHYPSCRSVSQMSEKNKKEFYGDRDEVIAQGYKSCGNCHP